MTVAKDKRTKDQKRKTKLAEKAKRTAAVRVEPYDGKKYQGVRWDPPIFATEEPVRELYVETHQRLRNKTVEAAYTKLVLDMRRGASPTLVPGADEIPYTAATEVEYLAWSIRKSWTEYTAEHGALATSDWEGILRTLLYSIQAHAWNSGSDRGYLEYLQQTLSRKLSIFPSLKQPGLNDLAMFADSSDDEDDFEDDEDDDGPPSIGWDQVPLPR